MSHIIKQGSGGSGGSGITTLIGDVGSATGTSVTLFANHAANNSGQSVEFVNSGAVSTLNVTDASFNTTIGKSSGNPGQTYNSVTCFGGLAGRALTTGNNCSFFGTAAGIAVTSGQNNCFFGSSTGESATTSGANSAFGGTALAALVGGTGDNCAFGTQALDNITSGNSNIGIGVNAGSNYRTSESSNIIIAATGTTGESNTIRLGTTGTGTGEQNSCFIAGINTQTLPSSSVVTINADGQLGVAGAAFNPSYFQAYQTTSVDKFAGSTGQSIIFDTVVSGTNVDGAYDPTTGIYTAQASGFFSFNVTALYDNLNLSVGATEIALDYTGSAQSLRLADFGIGSAKTGTMIIFSVAWSMPMSDGDTIVIQPFVDGTGTFTIDGSPENPTPFNTSTMFSGFRVA